MASNGFRRILEGLRLIPKATLTLDEKGDFQVLDSDGKPYYHNGTSSSPLITASSTDTLTNKTLTSPTINGGTITGATINPPSALTITDNQFTLQDNGDATKQLQFNASGITTGNTRILSAPDANTTIVGTDTTQTLTNKTLTSPTINGGTINPTSLTVPDNTFIIQDNVDNTKQLQFQASGISTGTTRTLTAPDANTTIVGTDTTQTITNKTITISDSNLTIQDNGDATKQAKFEASGITTGTTRTFTLPNGNTTLVGTDTTQTLSNKTLTAPVIDIEVMTQQGSTPSTPSAGSSKIYVKTDGNPYILSPSGVETPIGTATGGSKNYLTVYKGNPGNGNFESGSTTGWSLFNTTLTSLIPTGSISAGAASITTFNTVSSGQLALNYSLQTASSGVWAAGQGFLSDAFTIDLEDKSKVLGFNFYYSVISGAANLNFSGTSNNTFAVYIYDVTNSAWIQPTGVYSMIQNSGSGIASGSFQTTSNSTQYRIAILAINASAGAATVYWDDYSVGPQINSASLNGPIAAYIYRAGSQSLADNTDTKVQLQTVVFDTNSAYDATNFVYRIPVSGFYQIDASLNYANNASGTREVEVYKNGSTLALHGSQFGSAAGAAFVKTGGIVSCIAGDTIQINGRQTSGGALNVSGDQESAYLSIFKVPNELGSGASGNVTARYSTAAQQSIPNTGGPYIINFDTRDIDTNNSVTTGASWKFTAPISGNYRVGSLVQYDSQVYNSTQFTKLFLYKNGSSYSSMINVAWTSTTSPTQLVMNDIVSLNAGDFIDIRTQNAASAARTLFNDLAAVNVSINRIASSTAGSSPGSPPSVSQATRTSHSGGFSANAGGTYTTPAGALYLKLKMVGGGGGGGNRVGGSSGGNGGNSSFVGSLISLVAGAGGGGSVGGTTTGAGGSGGAATITGLTGLAIPGNGGGGGSRNNGNSDPFISGGTGGGGGLFGGGGVGGGPNTSTGGTAGAANTGGGGGGESALNGPASGSGAGGGGAGGIELIIRNPEVSYTFTIGDGGTAGGSSNTGGSGQIYIEEYYQ